MYEEEAAWVDDLIAYSYDMKIGEILSSSELTKRLKQTKKYKIWKKRVLEII